MCETEDLARSIIQRVVSYKFATRFMDRFCSSMIARIRRLSPAFIPPLALVYVGNWAQTAPVADHINTLCDRWWDADARVMRRVASKRRRR